MREPDALDAARVLVLALLSIAGAILLVSLNLASPAAAGVLQQVSFFVLPLLYARGAGLRPFAASGFRRLGLRPVALVLLASLGSFWLLNGLTQIQTRVIRAAGVEDQAKVEENRIREGIEGAQKGGAVPALSLLVLIPPLCEETLFRGILFRGLASRFGLGIALAATSTLFAALHQTLVQSVLMLCLGGYFAILVHLTRSLWASVIAHAVNNLAVLALMWIYGGQIPEFAAPWWMYAMSGLVFSLALVLLALERPPARD